MSSESYKRYPYKHHSLKSRPKYSAFVLDESIATALELINNHPELTDKQLKIVESAIKDYANKKNTMYLESSEIKFKPKTTNNNKIKKITFALNVVVKISAQDAVKNQKVLDVIVIKLFFKC